MADKKFTIALEGKVAPSVKAVLATMEQAERTGVKMSKAMQTAAGTGGGNALQQGAVAKSLLTQKKLFDDLSVSGTKLAKVLNEQVSRSQQALQKSLMLNASSLGPLVKQYEAAQAKVERMASEGASGKTFDLFKRHAQGLGTQVTQNLAERQQLQAAADTMYGDGTPGSGAGGPGGGSGGFGMGITGRLAGMAVGRAGVPFGGAMMAAGGAMSVVAIAAAAAIVAGKIIIANSQGLIASNALAGSQMSQQFASQRDATNLYGRAALSADPSLSRDLKQNTTPGFLRALPGNVLDSFTALADIGGAGYTASFRAKAANRERERITERVGELGAAKGPQGDVAKARVAEATRILGLDRRYGLGTYEAGSAMESKYVLDRGSHQAALGALAPNVGARSAKYYANAVLGAQVAGMDQGAAASIIGRTAVGGGNVLGVSAGFDPTIRALMGESVAGTMGASSMMFEGKGVGMARALAGGVNAGGAEGVRQAQQVAQGASLFGARMGGNDPYQKSFNMAAASAALGDASPYQKDFLATQLRDPSVAAGIIKDGKLPADFQRMGITLAQVKTFAAATDRSSVGARWIDTGGKSDAEKQMRAFQEAGGVRSWMEGKTRSQQEAAIKTAAPLYAAIHRGSTGGEVGAGEGILRFEAGLSTRKAEAGGKRAEETMEAYRERVKLENGHGKLEDAARAMMKLETATEHVTTGMGKVAGKLVSVEGALDAITEAADRARSSPWSDITVPPGG